MQQKRNDRGLCSAKNTPAAHTLQTIPALRPCRKRWTVAAEPYRLPDPLASEGDFLRFTHRDLPDMREDERRAEHAAAQGAYFDAVRNGSRLVILDGYGWPPSRISLGLSQRREAAPAGSAIAPWASHLRCADPRHRPSLAGESDGLAQRDARGGQTYSTVTYEYLADHV